MLHKTRLDQKQMKYAGYIYTYLLQDTPESNETMDQPEQNTNKRSVLGDKSRELIEHNSFNSF